MITNLSWYKTNLFLTSRIQIAASNILYQQTSGLVVTDRIIRKKPTSGQQIRFWTNGQADNGLKKNYLGITSALF